MISDRRAELPVVVGGVVAEGRELRVGLRRGAAASSRSRARRRSAGRRRTPRARSRGCPSPCGRRRTRGPRGRSARLRQLQVARGAGQRLGRVEAVVDAPPRAVQRRRPRQVALAQRPVHAGACSSRAALEVDLHPEQARSRSRPGSASARRRSRSPPGACASGRPALSRNTSASSRSGFTPGRLGRALDRRAEARDALGGDRRAARRARVEQVRRARRGARARASSERSRRPRERVRDRLAALGARRRRDRRGRSRPRRRSGAGPARSTAQAARTTTTSATRRRSTCPRVAARCSGSPSWPGAWSASTSPGGRPIRSPSSPTSAACTPR